MRIVSLVPGATEMLVALGAGEQIVGRSAECDHPPEVRRLPAVTDDTLPAGLDSAVIDALLAAGGRRSELALTRLRALRPDLVVAQDLCGACAPAAVEVMAGLGGATEVISISPLGLDDVLGSAEVLGAAAGRPRAGLALAERLRSRLAAARERSAGLDPVRVVCLEWLAPLYCAGHWIPEQVIASGGADPLGRARRPAAPMRIDDVRAAAPEAVVLMPCGWGPDEAMRRAGSEGLLDVLASLPGPPAVLAADASGHFSRPGPRLVDGVEWLAGELARVRAGSPARALR